MLSIMGQLIPWRGHSILFRWNLRFLLVGFPGVLCVMKFELGIRQNLLFSQFSLNKPTRTSQQTLCKISKNNSCLLLESLIPLKSSILPTLITLLSQTYANINDIVLLENTGVTSSHLPLKLIKSLLTSLKCLKCLDWKKC